MCYAKSEGGQRCYSHARERVARLATAYGVALNAADPETVRTANDAYQHACYELASTRQGVEDIKALQAQDPTHAQGWEYVLQIGGRLRDRNIFLRRVAAAQAAQTPHPLQGQVAVDTLVRVDRAVAAVLADPDAHVQMRGPRIKQVKPRFRTQSEKETSVARWRDRLESHAFWYANRAEQNRFSDEFITAVAHLEDMSTRPDAANLDANAALDRLPMEMDTRPDLAWGPEAQRMRRETEPHRRAEREDALIVVLYAARLDQALRQPVRP